MEVPSVKNYFYKHLECPICLDYFTPPVSICPNGHSICKHCAFVIRNCPICQAEYSEASRNLTIQKMLQNLMITCKYQGCQESISLAGRTQHYKKCPFNNSFKCPQCNFQSTDLVDHLVYQHQYKEIIMEPSGGLRSFSGPFESWDRDTQWPKGIWRFGDLAVIVHAQSVNSIFHILLFRISSKPVRVGLNVEIPEFSIKFEGEVPCFSEFRQNKNYPHFHCEVSSLLQNFVIPHQEDEEILRLWVNVQRKDCQQYGQ